MVLGVHPVLLSERLYHLNIPKIAFRCDRIPKPFIPILQRLVCYVLEILYFEAQNKKAPSTCTSHATLGTHVGSIEVSRSSMNGLDMIKNIKT
jgi:hypothetical protein